MMFFHTAWHWNPIIIGMIAFLWGGYGYRSKFKSTAKAILFTTGCLLILIALAAPMGPAGAAPIFSMHMARHIILLMLAPPLVVAGLPTEMVKPFFERPYIKEASQVLLNPLVTWGLGVGSMWFWHIPALYNRSVAPGNFWIPAIEILSLIGIGMLYCWPILSPLKRFQLSPLKGIIYLFTACSGCSILGILIVFAHTGIYQTAFASGADQIWGLTRSVDQQLGGLLMWVPGCFIYLTGVLVLLVRWFSDTEAHTDKQPAQHKNPTITVHQ